MRGGIGGRVELRFRDGVHGFGVDGHFAGIWHLRWVER